MNEMFPKVLVITRNAWNNGNCTGNTLSNFFDGWPDDKIANAYFRSEPISNNVCKNYFKITEQDLLRSLRCRTYIPGNHIMIADYNTEESKEEIQDISNSKKIYSFFSHHRWTLAIWARDLLWFCTKWGNTKFVDFLQNYSPDVLYMPCYDSVYMHRILWFVKSITNARIVLFTGDDTYTLKQFSLSPLYWINRFINRFTMRKSVKLSDTLFVISDLQKKEYDKIFRIDCKILRKGGKFKSEIEPKNNVTTPIKMVYTGNIHAGRWKTLAVMVNALEKINKIDKLVDFDIYTLSHKTDEMIKALDKNGTSRLMPPASEKTIMEAIKNADVLVFVEPFTLRERLKWRLSFSTKIVDYLASSRAIVAIGPEGLSSMDYLKSNDAAYCITNRNEIEEKLEYLIKNPSLISQYAEKSWKCGSSNNRIEDTKKVLMSGLMGD